MSTSGSVSHSSIDKYDDVQKIDVVHLDSAPGENRDAKTKSVRKVENGKIVIYLVFCICVQYSSE